MHPSEYATPAYCDHSPFNIKIIKVSHLFINAYITLYIFINALSTSNPSLFLEYNKHSNYYQSCTIVYNDSVLSGTHLGLSRF